MVTLLKRFTLFALTNVLVLVVLGTVLRLTGLDELAMDQGLPMGALLAFAAVVGFTGSFISLAISKPMAKWSTGAQVIVEPRSQVEAWLLATVQRQAAAAGIGVPEVAIYPSAEPNAFATGMSRDHALVAVSEGLLRSMRPAEVEAVLAHEVAHVANGDMVTMALIQGVVNTFVVFLARVVGFVVDRALAGDREERNGVGPGYYLATLVAEIFLGVLASLVVAWFSRLREFRADAGSAALEGAPKMIAALRALGRANGQSELPKGMAAFGIRGGGGLLRLFSSHPSLEDRITALERAAALHPTARPA